MDFETCFYISGKRGSLLALKLILLLSFGVGAKAQPFEAANEYNIELDNLPFTGVLILSEYDHIFSEYTGIIQIDLPTGAKKRLFDGKFPSRHISGKVTYNQSCGSYVQRIMLVDETGLPVQITPCSSEMEKAI